MALNLAQALGILVQSAQAHLNGELLSSESDKALLKESIDLLMLTEQKLEEEKNEQQSAGDGSAGESSSITGGSNLDPAI
jgi:hypothetical protein